MNRKKIEISYKSGYNKIKDEVTPKKDFFFKRIFGTEGNEEILKDLLEAILDLNIESLKLGQETIMPSERYKEKGGILDIRATLFDGTKINLEMQLDKFGDIGKRAIFYLSKLYVKSIKSGTGYDDFPKTIVIFITNYIYYHDITKYHTKWMLTEIDNVNKKLENVEIHIIELGKFRAKKPDMANKLEQWLSYIDYDRKEWREVAIEKNEKIAKAQKELEKLTEEQKEYLAELEEKGRLDKLSIMHALKKEIAIKMLELDTDIEVIEKVTELNKEEILKLKEEK